MAGSSAGASAADLKAATAAAWRFCLSSLSPSSTNASPRTASSGLRDAAFASVAASLKLFLAKALWAISSETRPLSGWSGKSFRSRAHAVSAPRGGGQVGARIGLDERAQLAHALVALPARDQGLAQRVAGVRQQSMVGILGGEAPEQADRLVGPLQLGEGAGQVEGGRWDVGVLGVAREEAAELGDRLVAALELEVHPGEAVDRVGRAGRIRIVGEDPVVDGARFRIPLHPEQRLTLPEARLVRPAGDRREGLGLAEGLERSLGLALGEARLAEEQRRVGRARIRRVALEQALQHAAGLGEEPILEGAIAHRPEPLGLAHREGGARPAEERGQDRSEREAER